VNSTLRRNEIIAESEIAEFIKNFSGGGGQGAGEMIFFQSIKACCWRALEIFHPANFFFF
jgi:hypothetical protein